MASHFERFWNICFQIHHFYMTLTLVQGQNRTMIGSRPVIQTVLKWYKLYAYDNTKYFWNVSFYSCELSTSHRHGPTWLSQSFI